MAAADVRGDPRRLAMLAHGDVAFEADVEGVDRAAGQVGHDGGDQPGVDAAAHERAERHVRDQHAFHRRAQLAVDGVGGLALVEHQLARVVEPPERLQRERGPAERQRVARRQLLHGAQHRVRRRDELALEVQPQRSDVDVARHGRVRDHGLQLGSEHQRVPVPRVVERLHAQVVARREQRAVPRVPEREREHAAQPRHDGLAPRVPAREQHLGVAGRAERPPAAREFVPQRPEVVDLAVEHDGHAPVRARHRLRAAGDVDDREPAVPEVRASRREESVGVGPAVRERTGHRGQHLGCVRRVADVTRDAAHRKSGSGAAALGAGRRAAGVGDARTRDSFGAKSTRIPSRPSARATPCARGIALYSSANRAHERACASRMMMRRDHASAMPTTRPMHFAGTGALRFPGTRMPDFRMTRSAARWRGRSPRR